MGLGNGHFVGPLLVRGGSATIKAQSLVYPCTETQTEAILMIAGLQERNMKQILPEMGFSL